MNNTITLCTKVCNRFKKAFFPLSLIIALSFSTTSFAGSGIFEGYAIFNGGFYDLTTATANPDFQGANLGSFATGGTFTLGGQIKTFKNGADNICGGKIWYSIYPAAGVPGAFTSVTLNFDADLGGGDQRWTINPGGAIAFPVTPGAYRIAVYVTDIGDGAGGCTLDPFHTSNNGGANWVANFNVCGTGVGALPAGNYAIPGCFATVASAVSYINTNGVTGTGTVQFNVAAGHTETAPAGGFSITATGTATLAIKFVKSGIGANPTFTAPTTHTVGALNDAVFKIIGGDYITIDGFTLQENALNLTTAAATNNMTEWGVALLYASATNGAQNNTIQNCSISLNRTYTNTFGIYSNTRHTATSIATAADITAVSGANINNKVYTNTISNVNMGIAFIGTGMATLQDTGNDIGGGSLATGNTITNWGGAAAASGYISNTGTSYCIFMNHQVGDNVSYNTITSATISGTAVTLRGILKDYTTAGATLSGTTNITNNTVTITNNFTSGTFECIRSQGTVVTGSTFNINNNRILNTSMGGVASSTTIVGIVNSSAPGVLNMNSNIVQGTTSTATTGGLTGVSNTGAVATTINMNSNQIGNATGGAITFSVATSGAVTGITNTGGASTAALSMSTNDVRGIVHSVAGSSTHVYITNGATTLSQTISSNTFTNLSVNTTASVTFISNSVSAPATGFKTVNSNSIVTAFNKGGAGGTVALYTDGGSSTATAGVQNNNNNFSNITVTGATIITGWFNNDGTGATPVKTITGNTFNNWTGGTSSIIALQSNFGNPAGITGNTITNITGQSTITGLLVGSSGTVTSLNLSSNTINGLTSTGTGGTVLGISTSASATTVTVSNNIINTLSSTGTSASITGIQHGGGTTINNFKNKIYDLSGNQTGTIVNGINITLGTTYNISNNLIGDLRATAATSTNAINGVNASATATYNVYYNNIYLNASSTSLTTFGSSCITFSSSVTAFNSRNNILINLSTPAQNGANLAANGISAAVRRSGGTTGVVPTNYSATSNNNLYFVNPASGTNNHLTYVEGTFTITNPRNTVADLKTFMLTRDQQSVEENSTFASTSGASANFLHFAAASSTLAESAANNIATFTDDYDGNTRQGNAGYGGTGTAPDIGADEFEGTNPSFVATTIGATALVAPATTGCFSATETVTVTVKNYGTAMLNFATNPLTVTTNVTGAAIATLTGTLNTGTLAVGASTNINMSTTLNMSATGVYTFNATATVVGDLSAADDAMVAVNRTVTPSVTLPQTVDFTSFTGSNLTTFFPNWSEAIGASLPAGTTSAWTSSTAIIGSGTTAKINLFSTGKNEWIVGPKFLATANTQLSFKIAITDFNSAAADLVSMTGSDDKVIVKISTNCGLTFSDLVTFDASNTGAISNTLATQTQSLAAYAGQNVIIAFFGTEGAIDNSNDYDFHIDDINIQDVVPIDLGAMALFSPAASGCFTATENISVTIKNHGANNLDFSVTPASVTVDVTGAVTTSFTANITTGSLLSGASMNVSMPSTLDMRTPGTYTFNASTTITGDGLPGNNAMAAANRVGSNPTVTLASNTPVCEGSPINLTANSSGGNINVITLVSGTKTETPALAIPDNDIITGATSTLALTGAGTLSATSSLQVTLNIAHTFVSDLDIYLVGPAGCGAIELSTDNGSSGDNYTGTILLTGAATSVTAGVAPFTGTFNPEGTITGAPIGAPAAIPAIALNGCPVNGTWSLRAFDDVGSDVGTISNWALSITTSSPTGLYTDAFSGTGTFGSTTYSGANNSQGDVNVTGVADGIYTYSVTTTDANGCSSKPTTTDVTVNNSTTYYADSDGDTYGDAAATTLSCTGAPSGYVLDNTDCNDASAAVNPGATEVCGNGIDDDCDGSVDELCTLYTFYEDFDLDTYGNPAVFVTNYTGIAPAGFVADNTDCNDADAAINPAATEICDGIDNDCDGSTDEGVLLTFYADADSDTYGDAGMPTLACSAPTGYVANSSDCNDADAAINPSAIEICDGIDNNCNGLIDNADPLVTGQPTWYADADGDTYGNVSVTLLSCTMPVGYVAFAGDCNDVSAAINPGATEVCNGIDDDCDVSIDEGLTFLNYYVDADGDGYGDASATAVNSCSAIVGSVTNNDDCDDTNNAINPAATEVCDGVDNDCDGLTDEGVLTTYYVDTDGDGYGCCATTLSCTLPAGYALLNGDCNNSDNTINPGATEIPGDGIDQNCDGQELCYADTDNDGARTLITISSADADCIDSFEGQASDLLDCDDTNPAIGPFATEVCNGIDDDCDGSTDEGLIFLDYYVDADGDTYGDASATAVNSCSPVAGSVTNNSDCNDSNAAINPAATEICDGIDNDCDGSTDEGVLLTFYADADSDTYGDAGMPTLACSAPMGYVANSTDCNDADAAINPAAIEICDGIDNNCNGLIDNADPLVTGQPTWYADADGDTYGNVSVTLLSCTMPVGYAAFAGDCNDGNAAIYPGATEVCNSVDDDCNGIADDGILFLNYYVDADADGYGDASATAVNSCSAIVGSVTNNDDCDDNDAAINPAATEICDGIDNNCDGSTDEGLTFLNYYVDADGDGYGDASATAVNSCSAIVGSVTNNSDCNDANNAINPAATEICDGVDNDCDGSTDEGLTFLNYYVDADGDGYGDESATAVNSCAAIAGSVTNNSDCNDANNAINPAATEICDGIDNDCDGSTDEGVLLTFYADADSDSYGDAGMSTLACSAPMGYVSNSTDCNDANSAVNPGATEVCNGIDDDCDGSTDEGLTFLNYYVDADADTYGDASATAVNSCAAIVGSVTNNDDCDDTNNAINPAATEVCDGVDNDCDGSTDEGVLLTFYADTDSDTYGDVTSTTLACSAPSGYVSNSTDCNDANSAINPGATEVCNGIDDDCDGSTDEGLTFLNYYVDADADGYGDASATAVNSCSAIVGSVTNNDDCDDTDAAINPAATEICDGVDNDCDGSIDEGLIFTTYYADADSDTYGDISFTTSTCDGAPFGYVTNNTDCNDADANINPGEVEICNGIDDNCDGSSDEGLLFTIYYADTDGDTYGDAFNTTTTCDGVPSGYVTDNTDCDDTQNTVFPGGIEICDGLDNNCDGNFDEGTVSASITPTGTVQICRGTSATLTANAGVGYTYQWFKNGNIILGATASTFNATKPAYYQVQVNSPEGCFALSSPTTLSVLASPNANISAPNGTSLCTSVKLKASYLATNTYQWRNAGVPIPGATSYLYFPTTPGSYTCTVTGITGCARTTSAIVVTACKEGELAETTITETFDMFPNPTESVFVIELSLNTTADAGTVQLFNIMGEVVYTNSVAISNGNISESIELNDSVPAGMYIVKVTVEGREHTKQLILQK